MESLKGRLLVAGAGIGGVFRQTVILMAEHDEKGALGFVLNRPAQATVSDIAPTLLGLPLFEDRLYLGGPVQPEVVTVLAEFAAPDDAAHLVFGNVGFMSPEASAEEASRGTRAKPFAGYAGWGPGQLESELAEEGSWIVDDARVSDVFSDRPDRLWRDVLRRKGSKFALLSTMPIDPSSN